MLKLKDNRQENKKVIFKDLPVGAVFEHPGLKMIFIKIETFERTSAVSCFKNAIRLDNREDARGNGCGEAWSIAPEGTVHPINAELVITD